MGVKITEELFGVTEDGKEVDKYTLENDSGMKVAILSYGATIQSVIVPDKDGKLADIALGYETLKDYEQDKCYIGALCGRVANRISNAQFTIDGVTYHLGKNDGENHIHGGFIGFNKKLYTAKIVDKNSIEMTYTSDDGEEGYPGVLTVVAHYALREENELLVRFVVVTTKATAINIVQHTYFNLAGHQSPDVLDHTLFVDADQYATKKENGYPSGELAPVSDTVFDFRKARRIGDSIEQVPGGIGYDHNLCLPPCPDPEKPIEVAKLHHPGTGRTLVVRTNQPGIQVYTSYYLNGEQGKDGAVYNRFGAICLETQNYPDAINQPKFPNAVLRPGEFYHHEIVYKFSVE